MGNGEGNMTKDNWIKARTLQGVKYLQGNELREILMKKYDGKCFWCNREVKIYPDIFNRSLKKGEHYPDDSATIEHLNDGVRGFKPQDPTGKYKVLACYKCNHERGLMLSRFIEKLANDRLKILISQVERDAIEKGYKQRDSEIIDEVELEEAEEAHRTAEGYCCACGYDMAVMEGKINNAIEKTNKRCIEELKTLRNKHPYDDEGDYGSWYRDGVDDCIDKLSNLLEDKHEARK